ncbi:hypothetical protein B0H14DRAFT_514346 [Mycena olivaceomarginata]|nr:hypothetical protein B0H14DRAFT_514346 [Mycena olivaceomarginata]
MSEHIFSSDSMCVRRYKVSSSVTFSVPLVSFQSSPQLRHVPNFGLRALLQTRPATHLFGFPYFPYSSITILLLAMVFGFVRKAYNFIFEPSLPQYHLSDINAEPFARPVGKYFCMATSSRDVYTTRRPSQLSWFTVISLGYPGLPQPPS